MDISIHALVKRATRTPLKSSDVLDISIHALVKRATLVWYSIVIVLRDFNPRPREEGDFKSSLFDNKRA